MFYKNVRAEKDSDSVSKFSEKLAKFKIFIKQFPEKLSNDYSRNDEILFEQFSELASPELIAFEHVYTSNEVLKVKPKHKKKNTFSYKDLPVIPFIAPRTNKLKIINFTKKIDREIISLIDVFEALNLKPDNIDLDVKSFLKRNQLDHEHNLIENTSMRFQLLEDLKDAIIYLPLKPPMQYYYISSHYGYRIHPKSKLRQMHYGIDMAGTWQEEVRAPADGFVSFSGRNGSFGKSIKIIHKHGVSTLYGHLHKLSVKKGQYVKEGQVIGKMGSTGRAVGAHLHYEIKVNGKSVNPYNFKNRNRGMFFVALAGPFANLIMAIMWSIIFTLFFAFSVQSLVTERLTELFSLMCTYGVFINLLLMFFNLLPIPEYILKYMPMYSFGTTGRMRMKKLLRDAQDELDTSEEENYDEEEKVQAITADGNEIDGCV